MRPGKTSPGTVLGGGVLFFGGHQPDRRQLAGPRIGIDGGRGGDLCRVDECRRRSGPAGGEQGETAASAFETAFAATVPPPVIAANRAQLAMLVATDFLGINSAAIMATEALYAEMWPRTRPPCTAMPAPRPPRQR